MRQNKGTKSKKNLKMSAPEFGLKETQLLFSQIIHDLISLFTSLSTGIDFAQDTQGEVWELVKKAKDQLYAKISLFRFVFGIGEGNPQDANNMIQHFGKAFNIEIEIKNPMNENPKLVLALALWLAKQTKNSQGATLIFDTKKLTLSSPHPFISAEQDDVLQGIRCFQSCQESYAGYIASLLLLHKKKLFISRSFTEVCIEVETDLGNSKSFGLQTQE